MAWGGFGWLPLAMEDGAADSLRRVSEGVRDTVDRQPAVTVAVLVGLLLVIGLIALYAMLRPELVRRRRAREWFEDLLRAHRFDAEERRAVRDMAAEAGLEHPAILFLSRSVFERHSRSLPPDLQRDLRDRLYG